MKRVALIIGLLGCLVCIMIQAMNSSITGIKPTSPFGNNHSVKKKVADFDDKIFRFMFTDELLIDIVNLIALHKEVNIILPAGTHTITSKITINIEEPMSIDESWEMLITVLDIAGYSIIPKGDDLYMIVQNNKFISREPLPVYIGIDIKNLPDGDERIRVLHYLANLKVSAAPDSEVMVILKETLGELASYQVDEKSNSVLISGKARDIKESLEIIDGFDQTIYHEKLEIVNLNYTSAQTVASLFSNILQDNRTANRYHLDTKKESDISYFSQNVKIIPDKRLNKLFILGKEQAVSRIRDFIRKHIDVEMDSGESILHIHQLQYLDANSFAPILANIVQSRQAGGAGQSTGAAALTATERYFEGVLVRSDTPTGSSGGYFGGNKLIVAAKNDDWKVIKDLIEELDQPQPQVILEVLIVDMTVDQTRALANITRNAAALPVPGNSSEQAAMLGVSGVVVDPIVTPTTNVAADLLGNTTINPATQVEAGAFMLAISDPTTGRTWSITRILQTFTNTKVLSHPHIVAANNKKAIVSVGQTRLIPDEAIASSASTTVPNRAQEANLTVTITPRISSAAQVALDILVDITQFVTQSSLVDNTRTTRTIETSANVKSGSILALGGLVQTQTVNSGYENPLFGKVPILGWLTKGKTREDTDTCLSVFICPTVVPARLRGGAGEYTQDYIAVAKRYSQEGQLFDSLKDPITRFFFHNEKDNRSVISEFMGVNAAAQVNTIPTIIDLSEVPTETTATRVATSERSKEETVKIAQKTAPVTRSPERKRSLGQILEENPTA